jgi:hypothetical protein
MGWRPKRAGERPQSISEEEEELETRWKLSLPLVKSGPPREASWR